MRKAVDYVTVFLVNDSFAIIDKIISSFLNGVQKNNLVEDIENAKIYLKYVFNADPGGARSELELVRRPTERTLTPSISQK